jgi:two-component system, chemotaxis family, chemotaxis protein CheY
VKRHAAAADVPPPPATCPDRRQQTYSGFKRIEWMDTTIKILIVDDFATMRRILKNILKKIGFTQIIEADDGSNALKVLEKEKVDLVISDWNMPKMTGIEFLKAVRANTAFKDLPFLMVTAEAQKQNIIEAVQAGVSNYVVKPFTEEVITEKLAKILG